MREPYREVQERAPLPLRHIREPPPLMRDPFLEQVPLHDRVKEEQLTL